MTSVQELRKIFTAQGVTGTGKWKREDFDSTIIAAEFAAYEEDGLRKTVKSVAAAQERARTAEIAKQAEVAKVVDELVAKVAEQPASKAGMVVHAKGSVDDKIAIVRAAAEASGHEVLVETIDGVATRLVANNYAQEIILVWDDAGRYSYSASSYTRSGKTRKVRNVSEALRFLS